MSENMMAIITLIGFVILGLIGASIVTFINRRQKIKSVNVYVMKKEIRNPGITSQTGMPKFYVKLSLDGKDSRTVKYKISEKCYKEIPEGEYGTLVYQGSEPISFMAGETKIQFN